jgi:hypothetical protein
MTLHVVLLVSLKKLRWVGVHRFGLKLFGTMVWKLLIIELLFQWESNQIKTENCIGNWGHSWCSWKTLGESNLIDFVLQFSKLKSGKYWFFNGFCCRKFKQLILKFGFGRKNWLNPQCVHTWVIDTSYTSIRWKKKTMLSKKWLIIIWYELLIDEIRSIDSKILGYNSFK